MTQSAKAQEPSMEEILASIRRIIADDDAVKPAAKAEPAKSEPAKPEPVKPAPVAAKPAAAPAAAAPKPAPAPPPPKPPDATNSQDDIDAMFGPATAEPEPEPEPSPPPPPAAVETDILDLTEEMAAPVAKPAPAFRRVDAADDIMFNEAPAEPRSSAPPPSFEHSLMSATTSAAVDTAFNALAHTVLVGNSRTLDDLVREMLRPMLKAWIDDNLPNMVERLVRAEIERVSRGRG
jgi:uncharacterized protein